MPDIANKRRTSRISVSKLNRPFPLQSPDFVKKLNPDKLGQKLNPQLGKRFWTSIGNMWSRIYNDAVDTLRNFCFRMVSRGGSEGGEEMDKEATDEVFAEEPKHDLFTAVKKHSFTLIILLIVWLAGYLGFSVLWLLLVVVVSVWRERASRRKAVTTALARHAVRNERESIVGVVRDLPSWVYFPDTERAEWLNKIVKHLWPYVEGYVEDLLRTSVEPAVQDNLPSYLKSFRFEKIRLGRYPPRIGGVKVYTEHVGRDEMILDLEIFYAGDCDIEISVKTVKRLKAGIQDLQLHGNLRVEMRPLVNKMPLIGGMSIYFLNRPAIDFNLTNLADLLDVPGLSNLLHGILEDQLACFLVLPNRIPLTLIDSVDINDLRYPMPKGVLRITAVEARNLVRADVGFIKKGKSDPYLNINVGMQKFKTKVINNNLNPVWNQTFEALVFEEHGQTLDLDCWDEDPGSKDDPLGNISIDIHYISRMGTFDSWLPLEDIKHGDLHLKLEWLVPSENYDVISEQVADCAKVSSPTSTELLSCAILVVKLDSAKDLPVSSRSTSMPSPVCTLTVGQTTYKSHVQLKTVRPVWEETHHFLIKNPALQSLDLEVTDSKKGNRLGTLSVGLKELLLAQPDMVIERPFKLSNSGPQSTITLKMCLRVRLMISHCLLLSYSMFAIERKQNEDHLLSDPRDVLANRRVDEEDEEAEIEVEGTQEKSEEGAGSSGVDGEKTESGQSTGQEVTINGHHDGEEDGDTSSQAASPPPNGNSPGVGESNAAGVELRRRTVQPYVHDPKAPFPYGRIQMTIRYSSPRGRVIVVVHKASQLTIPDSESMPDSYIRAYLLPDKSKNGKQKTKVIKDTREPVFDHTFEFVCSSTELSERTLDIAVKHSGSFLALSNPTIGQLDVDLASLDLSKASTEWYNLKRVSPDSVSRLSTSFST
ncbi:extended synaptotagmin-2-like [Diadema setosum]|uniref:extended synaptotagmin-2-like n=1 Tax=Diadema setosum TaxID=31175 RepID=UPI003B3AA385